MAAETLRYVTLSFSGGLGTPMGERFDRSSVVGIESIRYLGPVEDGEYVGLLDLAGDLDAGRELLTASEDVLRYDIAGADGYGIVYGYYRTAGPVGDLLGVLYRNDIVLDWPIERRETEAGATMVFTVIGTENGIQQAVAEVPTAVDISVERVGRFEARAESRSLLTEKQAALLSIAVETGYYEVPRETTQRALAERVGVSRGTIADRLQRIERRVMAAHAREVR